MKIIFTKIYSKLIEIQKKGTQVICITGDIGFKVKDFEYKTDENIVFLASGIDFRDENNKILIFEHNIETKTLTWRYEFISILLNQ